MWCPESLKRFNIRFNTKQSEASLRARIEDIFEWYDLKTATWQLGPPFDPARRTD